MDTHLHVPSLGQLQSKLRRITDIQEDLALSVMESQQRLEASAELLAGPIYRPPGQLPLTSTDIA